MSRPSSLVERRRARSLVRARVLRTPSCAQENKSRIAAATPPNRL